MVFSSIIFLCAFLPVVYLLYLVTPSIKLKNYLLMFSSLIFYAYGEPLFVLFLIFSVFLHYLASIYVIKKGVFPKALLIALLVFDVLTLLLLKYSGFFCSMANDIFSLSLTIPSVKLPIGVSFYTFQIMSYSIDVYRNKEIVQRNFTKLLLYISFFPQLVAGPIVKYYDIAKQLDERKVTAAQTAAGIRRFIYGLGKKVIIANTMAVVADGIFAYANAEITMPLAWLAALTYSLQIYFDFSGYSDMAIGLGKMFGFHFNENFDYPYTALDIRTFWRKWHISLTSWFREYVYIPLGGNRKGTFKTIRNMFIIFLLTGLWHGANYTFIVWGLLHGLFMTLERYNIIPLNKIKWKPVRHLYTLVVVSLTFLIFRAENISRAWVFIKAAFSFTSVSFESMALFLRWFDGYFIFILVIACVFAFPVKRRAELVVAKFPPQKRRAEVLSYCASAAILLLCIIFLVSETYSPFIYFQF